VPPVETVVQRVRHALRYIDPANLLLAPDCGLMTISRELANAKAKLLVDVANAVRKSI
jgi:5-methyltetrahydropteroyltriglutamate--homocysteine methyltransferase